ncbi:perforin-1-like [Protopterus annectens]|uniref:perforin-1-like n=1 Tax=Protopterus annectens TaxID=7888 RepID=UPI001CFBA045|nr:perforin-1-like [Protopterus annectens]
MLSSFPDFSGGETGGCTTGQYQECQKAKFVPGHNLGGEGFDITTLKRKRAYVIRMEAALTKNKTCTLCRNTEMGGEVQKLPQVVVDWRVLPKCDIKLSSKHYDSSMSLVEETSSMISNDWKVGLGVMPQPGIKVGVALSGSHSTLTEFAMGTSGKDKYSYVSQEAACSIYSYRIRDKPRLKETFHNMLKSLPTTYHSEAKLQYRELIDIYGTHYIHKVQLGGRVKEVTALKTCKLALDNMKNDEVMDCLGVEASAAIGPVEISSGYKRCEKLKTKKLHGEKFSEKYRERVSDITGGSVSTSADLLFPTENANRKFNKWISSLPKQPDIISYSLSPLSKLANFNKRIKVNLKIAITEYIKEKAIIQKCPRCPKGSKYSTSGKCNCECDVTAEVSNMCCSKNKGSAEFTMVIEKANDLYGDVWGETDGYVVVDFRSLEVTTLTINNNDNPEWNYPIDFGHVNLLDKPQVKVTVYDSDGLKNDNLGGCSRPVVATPRPVTHTCYLNHGKIIFQMNVKCGPNLEGPRCSEYKPYSNLEDELYAERMHYRDIQNKKETNALDKHVEAEGSPHYFKFIVLEILEGVRGVDIKNRTEIAEQRWILRLNAHTPPGINEAVSLKPLLKA